jgi:uncharacterized protein (TIGR02145 family)
MKKLSLLIVYSLIAPMALLAQVSVSNFQATQGTSATTVTFNVSWTPTEKDSVWVFVDYNTAGTMKRLPLTTVTASAGAVHRPTDWGAWVVAPAGGEFATTVTLSSGTTYSYGSCAYAIPQPPTALYTAYNAITFTGTPPFVITLKSGSSFTMTDSPYTYTPVPDNPPASFTDATRAPGVIKCTMPTITRCPENKTICYGSAQLSVAANPAAAFRWYEGGSTTPVSESSGTLATYITASLTTAMSYSVTASIGACSVTSDKAVVSLMSAEAGTAPNSTVPFAEFNPCMDAAVNTVWYLKDTRNGGNAQVYKVKMLADNHIWMVQDLKFGNCDKTDFSGSVADQTDKVYNGYYGDCTNIKHTATPVTPANRGYLYDWAAAMQKAGAYDGSTLDVGCYGAAAGMSGTNPSMCRGICPEGWHIPTGDNNGEYGVLSDAQGGCQPYYNCWRTGSAFEGVLGGQTNFDNSRYIEPYVGYYWTSTQLTDDLYSSLSLAFWLNQSAQLMYQWNRRYYGVVVRCVRNY